MKRKKRPAVGRDFMRKTQFKFLEATDQSKQLPPTPPFIQPRGECVELPAAETVELNPISLPDAIRDRKSERDYLADTSLSTGALSYLLWATQGVNEIDEMDVFKTVPSAGARHPLETFLVINRVEDLPSGLYRYVGPSHQLEILSQDPSVTPAVAKTCLQPELIEQCAVAFVWTAVAHRMTWRYADRGYRYIHIEAGHVGQNLYLAGQAVGCGVCTTAAFHDDDLNRFLGLDGNDHFAVYIGTVGK